MEGAASDPTHPVAGVDVPATTSTSGAVSPEAHSRQTEPSDELLLIKAKSDLKLLERANSQVQLKYWYTIGANKDHNPKHHLFYKYSASHL